MRDVVRSGARVCTVLLALVTLSASVALADSHSTAIAPIKLGGVFAMTGPSSVVANPILAGYNLAFTQANSAGGVDGAKIDYLTENDQYEPSNTVPAVKALVESDHVLALAGIFGSDDSNAAIPYLNSHKIPFFDPIGGGAKVSGDKWIWQSEPSYSLEGKVMGTFLRKQKIKKIAAFYQQGTNEPEIASLKKDYGSSLLAVSYEVCANCNTDYSAQLSQIRGFRPDVVILLGTLVPTADFVKDAAANAYQPPKGWFANYPQGDPTWLALASACGCLNGSHVSSYADLTGHNPVAKAYAAAIKKYDRSQKNTNYGLYGYFNGSLIVRALRLVGKHPTAARLQSVLDSKFRNYRSGFTGVLNWTPNYRYGVKQFKIYKISGSKFVPITGWLSS